MVLEKRDVFLESDGLKERSEIRDGSRDREGYCGEMKGDDLILSSKNPIKCGQLKYVNLNCKDIDQFPLKKLLRRLNFYTNSLYVNYFPSIKRHDYLFVPEDITLEKRILVTKAIAEGVKTVVVQHGFAGDRVGFLPLKADYFLCWPEDRSKFIMWGMDESKVFPFTPQKPLNLNKIPGVNAVFFLVPPAKGRQFHDENSPPLYSEQQIKIFIESILIKEPNLKIKPHPKFCSYLKKFISSRALTMENAYDLINSADRIYSFKSCTTVKDCEVLGKKAILVDEVLIEERNNMSLGHLKL